MRIQTCSDHAKFWEDSQDVVIASYSYNELGIDINSRIAWDSNTLVKKIRTGYQKLQSATQLSLF